MISDFELLAHKIDELANLTHALRRENAELRAHASQLTNQNQELSRRIQSAHERVTALLARIPDPYAVDDSAVEAKSIQQAVV